MDPNSIHRSIYIKPGECGITELGVWCAKTSDCQPKHKFKVVRPFPGAIKKSRLNRIKFRVPKIAIVTGKPESFKKIISNYKRMAKYRYRGV